MHQLQQLQTQQNQHLALHQLKSNANFASLLKTKKNNITVFDSCSLTAINNKKNCDKDIHNTNSVQMPATIVVNLTKPAKLSGSILGAIVAQTQNQPYCNSSGKNKSSPEYDESTKLLKVL